MGNISDNLISDSTRSKTGKEQPTVYHYVWIVSDRISHGRGSREMTITVWFPHHDYDEDLHAQTCFQCICCHYHLTHCHCHPLNHWTLNHWIIEPPSGTQTWQRKNYVPRTSTYSIGDYAEKIKKPVPWCPRAKSRRGRLDKDPRPYHNAP